MLYLQNTDVILFQIIILIVNVFINYEVTDEVIINNKVEFQVDQNLFISLVYSFFF